MVADHDAEPAVADPLAVAHDPPGDRGGPVQGAGGGLGAGIIAALAAQLKARIEAHDGPGLKVELIREAGTGAG